MLRQYGKWITDEAIQFTYPRCKVYLKDFPGVKADQLNHHVKPIFEEYEYEVEIIHVGINDIFRRSGKNEVNDIPRKVINKTGTCQNYNITKIFISSIIRCSRTTVDINYINEKIRELYIQNNYEFISDTQINKRDLWRIGIHLQESRKILIAKNFINSVNNFLFKTYFWGPGVQHSI